MTNNDLKALAWGPRTRVWSWSMYFINGYKFHTKAWSRGKKTINSGVCVKGVTQGGEDDFYGVIERIIEIEYHGLPKIPLFYCQWFDPTHRGTRVHPQYKIVQINKRKRYQYYDPFIVAQKARQVYYVDYPDTCKDLRDWCVAIATKPRGHVEVDDIVDETKIDESPYQADECVVPPVEIETVEGLRDDTVNEYEGEFDPIRVVSEQIETEVYVEPNDSDNYFEDENENNFSDDDDNWRLEDIDD